MALQSDNTKAAPAGYYYLWHLAALGVITADFGSSSGPIPPNNESALRITPSPVISGSVWDTIAGVASISPARVALIDVGISPDHPNLATRIDQNASIDLATHRYGARALAILDDTNSTYKEEKQAFFAELDISGLGNLGLSVDDKEYLDDIVAEYAGSYGVLRRILDSNTMFAAHGTACAGLIVAEPAALPSEDGEIRLHRKTSLRVRIRPRPIPTKIPTCYRILVLILFRASLILRLRSKTMPYSSLPHSFMHIRRTLTSSSCHAAYPIRSEAPCSPRTN